MKKINLNKSLCIGCGACVAIASEYFEFDDNGLSSIAKPLEGDVSEEVVEAVNSCPTNSITLVDEEVQEEKAELVEENKEEINE